MRVSHSRSRPRANTIIAVCAVLLVILGGLAVYFFKQYSNLKANPNIASQETTKHVVDEVGKLYALPKDEEPTIAEVKDKSKLKDQPFFKNAQNKDSILIYQKAKIAIIYRSSENKLINVGPIAIDSSPQQGQTSATVKVLSATNRQGAAKNAAQKIAEIAGVSIDQNVTDAKNKTLPKTIVVDTNGSKADQAQQIAQKLGGTVGSLPADESAPAADIAVFVGAQ